MRSSPTRPGRTFPLPAALDRVEAASFEIPPGACDTHAHVVAADAQAYPMVAGRSTPHPATEQSYLSMLDAQGMARGVLVQISVYGTDNRYMLEVLRRHPDRLRGIGVVAPTVTDAELEAMHAAGVRGLRINVLFGGGIGFDAMETGAAHRRPGLAHAVPDGCAPAARADAAHALPVPGVIDHMGHMPVAQRTDSAGFQAMRHLLREHGWWAKLSGAYRISERHDSHDDVTPWARALIEAAPERCGAATGRMCTSRAWSTPAGCATSWRTGRRIRRCASASWWTTRSGCTASRQSERPGRAGARQARIAYSSAPRRPPRAHLPCNIKEAYACNGTKSSASPSVAPSSAPSAAGPSTRSTSWSSLS